FFFSSRRRHTRFSRDWSSDVCSSDLYSVVLLDEVEKAHPDVMNLFYQVFDKGILNDGEGREIDCRNVVFFITSNLGSDAIMQNRSEERRVGKECRSRWSRCD